MTGFSLETILSQNNPHSETILTRDESPSYEADVVPLLPRQPQIQPALSPRHSHGQLASVTRQLALLAPTLPEVTVQVLGVGREGGRHSRGLGRQGRGGAFVGRSQGMLEADVALLHGGEAGLGSHGRGLGQAAPAPPVGQVLVVWRALATLPALHPAPCQTLVVSTSGGGSPCKWSVETEVQLGAGSREQGAGSRFPLPERGRPCWPRDPLDPGALPARVRVSYSPILRPGMAPVLPILGRWTRRRPSCDKVVRLRWTRSSCNGLSYGDKLKVQPATRAFF